MPPLSESWISWACWIGGALLAAAALPVVGWALFWDRSRGRARCPSCWYSMADAPSLICPECGGDAGQRGALHRTRRRWLIAVGGGLLLPAGVGLALAPAAGRGGVLASAPTGVLIELLPVFPDYRFPIADELGRRIYTPAFDEGHRRRLAEVSAGIVGSGGRADARFIALQFYAAVGAAAPEHVTVVLDAMADDDPRTVEAAIYAVSTLLADGDLSIATLLEHLDHPSARVRLAAARALGFPEAAALDPEAAVAPLRRLLDDQSPAVRTMAARTLCRVAENPGPAVVVVGDLLVRGGAADRMDSVFALVNLGERAAPALPRLIEALAFEDVRYYAVVAIGNIGPGASAAEGALRGLLDDESRSVREAAARALRAIGAEG